MKKDLISIIMPVKNGAEFLVECLDSIVNQSTMDWELLAVNDGSTDQSPEILKLYALRNLPIKVLENKGQGIADALQTGWEQVQGEFITRMDCDDLMEKSKLEKMRDVLKANGPKHIAVTQVSYFGEEALGKGYLEYEAWLNRMLEENTVFENIYRECTIPSPSWMAYTIDIEQFNMLNDLGVPEDYELAFRFYEHGFVPVVVREKLHFWRDHPSRISRNSKAYDIRTFGLFKLKKFLKLERTEALVLWGSGKKGKEMAGYLVKNGLEFNWITDNPKKWNHVIHQNPLKSRDILAELKQPCVLVAVSNKKEQEEIRHYLENFKKVQGLDYFFFF